MPTYIPRNQSHLPPEKNEDSGYSFSSDGSNESFTQSDSNVDTYMGSGYDSYQMFHIQVNTEEEA